MGDVFFVERNIHGALVVYGTLGIHQYYGYTKREAVAKYKAEAGEKIPKEVRISGSKNRNA